MGFLTTHVLDTAQGVPAQNMQVRLYRWQDGQRNLLLNTYTNHDGRCDAPLLSEAHFAVGEYELEFDVQAYFLQAGITLTKPAFLDIVPIRFGIANANDHYHVPLLVSPYSFSTYRGS
jgi:5-hydroxyisourate hydrolase